MDGLDELFETVRAEQKTLELYTQESSVVSELETQFSTRNVRIEHREFSTDSNQGFIIVRDADGEFLGAVGIEQFQRLLSPTIRAPWDRSDDLAAIFDFLDGSLFTSFDRRQMLAVSREIEDRAWRVGAGELYVGFQRSEPLASQLSIYNRFATESDLNLRLFIEDKVGSDIVADLSEGIDIIAEGDPEIGRFWFLLFHAVDTETAVGLVAEERSPGEYYGFWTYDPVIVRDALFYLDATY